MTESLTPETQALRDGQWVYYAQWLELGPQERELRGLPRTEELLAAEFKTSARNLRKWKTNESFVAIKRRVDKQANKLRAMPLINLEVAGIVAPKAATPEPDDQDLEDLELDAGALENQDLGLPDSDLEMVYRRQALQGDTRAMKMYMDYFGKAKQTAALEASKVSYDQESLEGLVLAACEAVGPETLIRYLAANGWKVEQS